MAIYLIWLRGQVDVDDLNSMSPHQITLLDRDPGCTLLSIYTDQSGMIGMLRHLHNLGLHVLSVIYQPERQEA